MSEKVDNNNKTKSKLIVVGIVVGVIIIAIVLYLLINNFLKNEFVDDAVHIITNAEDYADWHSVWPGDGDTTCITLNNLRNDGYSALEDRYQGKVEITNNNGEYEYVVYLTDGQNYMIINQSKENINSDNVIKYNESDFIIRYHTCI